MIEQNNSSVFHKTDLLKGEGLSHNIIAFMIDDEIYEAYEPNKIPIKLVFPIQSYLKFRFSILIIDSCGRDWIYHMYTKRLLPNLENFDFITDESIREEIKQNIKDIKEGKCNLY